MFCPKCGTELPDDARFCLKCGQAQGGRGAISWPAEYEVCEIVRRQSSPAGGSCYWYEAVAGDAAIMRGGEHKDGGGAERCAGAQDAAYNDILSRLVSEGWEVILAGNGVVRRMRRARRR